MEEELAPSSRVDFPIVTQSHGNQCDDLGASVTTNPQRFSRSRSVVGCHHTSVKSPLDTANGIELLLWQTT